MTDCRALQSQLSDLQQQLANVEAAISDCGDDLNCRKKYNGQVSQLRTLIEGIARVQPICNDLIGKWNITFPDSNFLIYSGVLIIVSWDTSGIFTGTFQGSSDFRSNTFNGTNLNILFEELSTAIYSGKLTLSTKTQPTSMQGTIEIGVVPLPSWVAQKQ